jgi:hypothetical protein
MDPARECESSSFRFGAGLVVAVAVCLFLLPRMVAAGDLSGYVFIQTSVGEAKRISDLQVVIVPATPRFEAPWRDLVAALERERVTAHGVLKQAEAEKAAAQAEYLRLVGPGGPAFAEASAREGRALEEVERAKKAVAALPGQYPERAKALIRQQQNRAVRTGVDGHYRLSNLAPGKYYVFSEHEAVESRQIRSFVWFVPVTVTREAITVDLAPSNSGWAFTPLSGEQSPAPR